MVIATAKIANELHKMEKTEAVNGAIGFKDKTIYFRLSTSPDAIDNLQKVLNNTVIVKAKEDIQ